jgi:hypothetical protein
MERARSAPGEALLVSAARYGAASCRFAAFARRRTLLIVALAVGLAVGSRGSRSIRSSIRRPAYLAIAMDVVDGRLGRVLGGYYSRSTRRSSRCRRRSASAPSSRRLTALVAGLASLPLLTRFVRRRLGASAAAAAVLVAACSPALVKASARSFRRRRATRSLGWLVALPRRRSPRGRGCGARVLRAGGVFLYPLGLVRVRAAVSRYVGARFLVMARR